MDFDEYLDFQVVVQFYLLLDLLAVLICHEGQDEIDADDNEGDVCAAGETCHDGLLPFVLEVSSRTKLDCSHLEGRGGVLHGALGQIFISIACLSEVNPIR